MPSDSTSAPSTDGRVPPAESAIREARRLTPLHRFPVVLSRLLLLPLLSPLVATLVIAALNPQPTVSLRLLTWTSPRLPLGVWIGGAAGSGAALSGAASALALLGAPSSRRRRRGPDGGVGDAGQEPWTFEEDVPAPAFRTRAGATPAGAGPSRAPGEPAPTVTVPFRVVHRPTPTSAGSSSTASAASATAGAAAAAADPLSASIGVAVGADEGGWGDTSADDW